MDLRKAVGAAAANTPLGRAAMLAKMAGRARKPVAIAAAVGVAIMGMSVLSAGTTRPVGAVVAATEQDSALRMLAACGTPATAGDLDVEGGALIAAEAAWRVGLRGQVLVTAIAVAGAESTFRAAFDNSRSGPGGTRLNNNGTIDYGMWQINTIHDPPIPQIYDVDVNAQFMARISSGGTNWQPWEAYKDGSYLRYLDLAQATVEQMGAVAWDPVPADFEPGMVDIDSLVDPCLTFLGDGTVAGDAVAFALSVQGVPYSQCHGSWPSCGAGGRFGDGHYDCSGLVVRAYREAGLELPQTLWTTLAMRRATDPGGTLRHLTVADRFDATLLQPGDVMVWTNGPNQGGHMGMYIGDGQVVHASVSRGVTVDSVDGQFARRTQRIVRPSLLAANTGQESV